MGLRHQLLVLVRRWPVVAIVFVVVAGLLGFAFLSVSPTYAATSSVYVHAQLEDATVAERHDGDQIVLGRIQSYALAVNSEAVLRPVIDRLDLDQDYASLSRSIETASANDSHVIAITVTSQDADEAAKIANEVAEELPIAVAALDGEASARTAAIQFSTVQRALPPDSAVAPNRKLNLAVAALIGLLAAILAAVLAESFDSRLRRGSQVTSTGVRYLGGIPPVRGAVGADLIGDRVSSESADLHRTIAYDVLFAGGALPLAVVVTGVRAGAGTTTVTAGLATCWAAAGNRVLYIDADVSGGRLAPLAGVPETAGLVDVMAGRVDLDMALFYWNEGGFSVLPLGSGPMNVTEVLGGPQMRKLLELFSDLFDVVVFDTPSILKSPVAGMLLQHVPNAILVAQVGRTRRAEFAQAAASVQRTGARTLGAVLSRTSRNAELMSGTESVQRPGDRTGGADRAPRNSRRR